MESVAARPCTQGGHEGGGPVRQLRAGPSPVQRRTIRGSLPGASTGESVPGFSSGRQRTTWKQVFASREGGSQKRKWNAAHSEIYIDHRAGIRETHQGNTPVKRIPEIAASSRFGRNHRVAALSRRACPTPRSKPALTRSTQLFDLTRAGHRGTPDPPDRCCRHRRQHNRLAAERHPHRSHYHFPFVLLIMLHSGTDARHQGHELRKGPNRTPACKNNPTPMHDPDKARTLCPASHPLAVRSGGAHAPARHVRGRGGVPLT